MVESGGFLLYSVEGKINQQAGDYNDREQDEVRLPPHQDGQADKKHMYAGYPNHRPRMAHAGGQEPMVDVVSIGMERGLKLTQPNENDPEGVEQGNNENAK